MAGGGQGKCLNNPAVFKDMIKTMSRIHQLFAISFQDLGKADVDYIQEKKKKKTQREFVSLDMLWLQKYNNELDMA